MDSSTDCEEPGGYEGYAEYTERSSIRRNGTADLFGSISDLSLPRSDR
jgi:hypothetical protein